MVNSGFEKTCNRGAFVELMFRVTEHNEAESDNRVGFDYSTESVTQT